MINSEYYNALILLEEVLNALELNDQASIKSITNKLLNMKNSVNIAERYILWYEGWQLTLKNSFVDAINLFEQSLNFKIKTKTEKRFMAKIFSSIGGAKVALGDYIYAMKAFRKSLLLWDEGKQASLVYLNMGTLYRRTHKYNYSLQSYQKAFDNGSNFVRIKALSSIAQVAFDKKDLVKARETILKGYRIAKVEEGTRGKDDLYCNIGTYYKLIGKKKRAIKWLNKAIYLATEDKRIKQYAIAELIEIYLSEGLTDKADELLKGISASTNNDILYLATFLYSIAKKHQLLKNFQESYLILSRCYNLLTNIPPSNELIKCCYLLERYHLVKREPYVQLFIVMK